MEVNHLFNRLLARAVTVGLLAIIEMSVACGNPTAPPIQPPAPGVLNVTSLTPNLGPAGAATAVRMVGTGFLPGVTLTIDGVATPATLTGSTFITAVAPAHAAGPVDVEVINPGGASRILAGGYVYLLPVTKFVISGNTEFTAIGETSQLTVTVDAADGKTQDVTRYIQWTTTGAPLASVSPDGLLTARGLGSTTILARFQLGTSPPLFQSMHVTVTPPGTFLVTGRVREPGSGSVSGARVLNLASGQTVLTPPDGTYSFVFVTDGHLSVTKNDYEAAELDGTRNGFDDVPLQRIIRLAAGASVSPTLAPNDMDYLVNPATHCQPCRLIRVTSPTSGTMHVRVTWSDPPSVLNVWVNGQAFLGNPVLREVVADVPVGAGEVVLFVGKVAGKVGDYVPFTLATAPVAGPEGPRPALGRPARR
jgi:hypothetical protein